MYTSFDVDMREKYPWRKPIKRPIPDLVKPQIVRDFSLGLVYPAKKEVEDAREGARLPRLPPTGHSHEEVVLNRQKMIKKMRLDKKIGFDLDTMDYKYDE